MNATARTQGFVVPGPATCSAIGWSVAGLGLVGAAAANEAWGWGDIAGGLYGLATMALVVSGALLVVTQLRLSRSVGGLGAVATIGMGVTAVGALLSFVAWAVVVWTTVLGAGTLLFGVPLLQRGLVPRHWGLAITFALPAASLLAWAGAVIFDAGAEDASALVAVANGGLVGAAALVLAGGLAGLGRWMRSAEERYPSSFTHGSS